jgi:hypothetical protein
MLLSFSSLLCVPYINDPYCGHQDCGPRHNPEGYSVIAYAEAKPEDYKMSLHSSEPCGAPINFGHSARPSVRRASGMR